MSENEILDFYTTEEVSVESIEKLLKGKMPDGLVVLEIKLILENEPALSVQTMATRYRIEFLDDIDESSLSIGINRILNQAAIIRNRRGKKYDLRPLIKEIEIDKKDNKPILYLILSALQGATGRPDEVLLELNFNSAAARITRERTFLTAN